MHDRKTRAASYVKPVDILGDEISTSYSALCLNGKAGGGVGGGESEVEDGGLLYVLWLAEDETELRLRVKRRRGV